MSISNGPGAQFWLFKNQKSLIRPAPRDHLFEMIRSSLLDIGEWDEPLEKKHSRDYKEKMNSLFYNVHQ